MSAQQNLPGSFYQKRGRWYWTVKLPGENSFHSYPLKPVDSPNYATKERNAAVQVAKAMLEAAQVRTDSPVGYDGTVGGLVYRYRKHAEGYYVDLDGKPTTQVPNIRNATEPLLEKFATLPAEEFGPLALKEIRTAWCDGTLCRSTVNARVRIIQSMFKWAVGEQLVPETTYATLACIEPMPKLRAKGKDGKQATEPHKVRPVALPVVQATLAFVPKVIADMVTLQLLTGMRSTEVCYMRPCDVDRPAGKDAVWVYRVDPHANKMKFAEGDEHDRKVPLVGQARAIVEKYLLRPPTKFCFTPTEAMKQRKAEKPLRAVVSKKTGEPWPSYVQRRAKVGEKDRPCLERYNKDSYRIAIRHAVKAANRAALAKIKADNPKASAQDRAKLLAKVAIPMWHPHQLRHNASTVVRAAMGDAGREASCVLLGQTSISMADVYGEKNQALAVDAARKIDQAVKITKSA